MSELAKEAKKASERFVGLLDYVDALVKLDERVPHRLSQHKLPDGSSFVLHEHELTKLPGAKLNIADDEGPVWLRIQRLQRTAPPPIPENLLEWIDGSDDPTQPPSLHTSVHARIPLSQKDALIADGQLRPEDCAQVKGLELAIADAEPLFDVFYRLEDRVEVKAATSKYVDDVWATWAERELPRRLSINAYQKLFDLAQRLSQSGAAESIEVVWGIGGAKWSKDGIQVDLPLLELGVEIEIADDRGADVLIRPRHVSPRISLRAFDNLAEDQVQIAEQACQQALAVIERDEPEGMSPFKPGSFASVLKRCGGQLDSDFEYLPESRKSLSRNQVPPEAEGEHLLLNDRWVIYARKRSINAILRDIQRLKKEVVPEDGPAAEIVGAARTLIMGAQDDSDVSFERIGRKIVGNAGFNIEPNEPIDPDHGDLFFPKPFNEDQVQIIRQLEKADGIVVQGPPGTGKTHTIANIISHMLAIGKRVLVVSHGEPALRVVREHLPEGVRDLAISVTTSEREGAKQIEKAVQLMLEVVNRVTANMHKQKLLVSELSSRIIASRLRLETLDMNLQKLAEVHLKHVPGTELTTFDLAKQLVERKATFGWFTDRPSISFAESGLTSETIAELRDARQRIGEDLLYRGKALPDAEALPSVAEICSWHLDLREASKLTSVTSEFDAPVTKLLAHLGTGKSGELAASLEALTSTIRANASEAWAADLVRRSVVRDERMRRASPHLFEFVRVVREHLRAYQSFLARPVQCPAGTLVDQAEPIWAALCDGKNPFGLLAFGSRSFKSHFDGVRLAGRAPTAPKDWQYAERFAQLCRRMPEIRARWHALRDLMGIPPSVDFSETAFSELELLLIQLELLTNEIPNRTSVIHGALSDALRSRADASKLLADQLSMEKLSETLALAVRGVQLGEVAENIERLQGQLAGDLPCIASIKRILEQDLGASHLSLEDIEGRWTDFLDEIRRLRGLAPHFVQLDHVAQLIAEAGAPSWAESLQLKPVTGLQDSCVPADCEEAWDWARLMGYLEAGGSVRRLEQLHGDRTTTERQLRETFAELVKQQTFYNLAALMKNSHKTALGIFADIINRIGAGTGNRAVLFRRDAREAMESCYDAVPCWIMPAWRVSEQLPSKLNSFDLVILDEASQSDAKDLPAILRGKKLLVVGDDKQVSPTAAFVSLANIRRLRNNHLRDLPYRTQVEPGGSLYDLARVMFPGNFVMLKEHFRCVEPIIRFSTRFYTQPLIPLRVPTASERMDPPLIDIFVRDGRRRGKTKINPREAEVIVEEIVAIVADPTQSTVGAERKPRTIGVISLIGAPQAALIQRMLLERLGEESFLLHQVVCGDSATLQGNERDIVFLSMVADPNNRHSQTAQQYAQRFNVALSRARDRMYLVRSVNLDHLNPKDLKASVIQHFRQPMPATAERAANLIDLCQSGFEREMFEQLTSRGYKVTPQVGSQGYFIDLVVEGEGGRRLAIECDGDAYHGPERWHDDMRRQRTLERVGWVFWRCFGSDFILDRSAVMEDLIAMLQRMGIDPVGANGSAYRHTEHREVGEYLPDEMQVVDENDASDLVSGAVSSKTRFAIGDRIIVRLSDHETEKQLNFEVVAGPDDIENGLLNIQSNLLQALATIELDEEMSILINGVETNLVFVRHEAVSAVAA